jgi:serine/threonine protein kinase
VEAPRLVLLHDETERRAVGPRDVSFTSRLGRAPEVPLALVGLELHTHGLARSVPEGRHDASVVSMGKLPLQIGPYSISRLLGSGGSGAVYLARESDTGREVALKVLFLPRGGPGDQRRFEREVAALRALDHPNLVRHVADGVTPEGAPWLAMERIQGETLEARLARGPLPLGQAISLARQLAAGLAEAHRRGIVHRDVKPANVLWAPDGRIVLTDFGLAKELEVEESRRLSTTGVLMGTPDYWAPEQASGEHARGRPSTRC